jgi:hypothetical protein
MCLLCVACFHVNLFNCLCSWKFIGCNEVKSSPFNFPYQTESQDQFPVLLQDIVKQTSRHKQLPWNNPPSLPFSFQKERNVQLSSPSNLLACPGERKPSSWLHFLIPVWWLWHNNYHWNTLSGWTSYPHCMIKPFLPSQILHSVSDIPAKLVDLSQQTSGHQL